MAHTLSITRLITKAILKNAEKTETPANESSMAMTLYRPRQKCLCYVLCPPAVRRGYHLSIPSLTTLFAGSRLQWQQTFSQAMPKVHFWASSHRNVRQSHRRLREAARHSSRPTWELFTPRWGWQESEGRGPQPMLRSSDSILWATGDSDQQKLRRRYLFWTHKLAAPASCSDLVFYVQEGWRILSVLQIFSAPRVYR